MRFTAFRLASLAGALTGFLAFGSGALWAQSGNQGTVTVTVEDVSGALVPTAKLELVENRSNSARSAETDSKGLHSFVNLNIGTYRLTVSHAGYQTKVYQDVLVESSTTTTLNVMLPVGEVTQTVNVTSQANAVLQTSSTEVGTVINTTDIENLPISGRALSSLTTLTPGYTGTWNGLPEPAEGTNIDGAVANNGRTKYQGTIGTSVSPRVESFEQASIVSDGLNLGNGFGTATMQLNYISRRGSNQFHGRAYYDFRNDGLNANSWANDAVGQPKQKLIQHDFGVSVGGPIFRNKLFFFGTYAEFKQPGTSTASNYIFPSSVVQGNFTYTGTDKAPHTVNVFQLAQQYDPTLPNTINPAVNTLIQNALTASNGLRTGGVPGDTNLTQVFFSVPSTQTQYYPVARLDYNMNDKVRMYLSWIMTQINPVGSYPAPFPGSGYASQAGNNFTRNFNLNYGLDYIITPQLINQFKVGFLYSKQAFAATAAPNWQTNPPVFFNMTGDGPNRMSGLNYTLPSGYEYPVFSLSDAVSWEKGSHNFNFGFQGYREQDHYYNPPVGFGNINFGLVQQDPATNAFTTGSSGTLPAANSTIQGEAEQIYAILTGRISGVSGSNGYDQAAGTYKPHSFNLDEVALATGVWAQDSWKVKPTLTFNYGLRWDFTVDPHDVKAAYHNADLSSILGPTSMGNLFQPGALGGNTNPAFQLNPRPFHGWYKTPQPQFALNWNPRPDKGTTWYRILGDGGTSIRAGFGLRHFTQPYQFYWDAASAQALLYYQSFALTPNTTGVAGTYTPGSLAYGAGGTTETWSPGTGWGTGGALPGYLYNPTSFPTTAPLSSFTFINRGVPVEGINPDIRMPYTESWNFGIQRSLAHNTVLEVRYNGNRTIHNWTALNYNEVNIVENGFLQEFKNAQANLKANGGKTFVDTGAGDVKTPILDAAFAGSSAGQFTSSTFITYLNTGAAGSFARQLAGNNQSTPTYFCNLVGSSFGPCQKNAGFNGPGAGYPINFFQANPYAPGANTAYMTDAAYSNYNGLQVDLRQAPVHGVQGDVNYTWSKTLGFGTNNNDYLATADNFYTLRDLHRSYVPQSFDVRHIVHGYATYELPFGKNKMFFNSSTLANEVVGGFTLGTVMSYQTGFPFLLTGGYDTFNQYDGGVTLNGVTPQQLQSKVGVHHIPGHTTSLALDPSLYSGGASGGTANTAILAPNMTPGTIGRAVFLYGPHVFAQNMSLSKLIPIRESIALNLQAEFINVWNHPTWGTPSGSLTSSSFGTSSVYTPSIYSPSTSSGARQIELRGNITF